jgi:RNA polymerase sigma-54 factor
MALSAKLVMRQGQALVMTPQLMQAIKLLQLSNLELASFIEEELERNPLLERVEETHDPREHEPPVEAAPSGDPVESDWSRDEFETDRGALESGLGTELENSFDGERSSPVADPAGDMMGLSATSWTGAPPSAEGEGSSLERYVASRPSLHDHLAEQLQLAVTDPVDRLIGMGIIDAVDESGYLSEPLDAIAERLGVATDRVEALLGVVHGFDPTGIGARSLAECLSLQLKERDRFDPAMAALIGHLDLLARRDHAALRRICGVDDDDLADMVGEIRRLDPKPGRSYGGGPVQTVVPDVYVRVAPDGSWLIDLNSDVLPRVLVNQTYRARIVRGASDADKSFVNNCLQTANWLTKSLEQRARTILKVSSEIVRQQDAFFAHGVQHLRPLNLKAVADAIGMHESTVSRVTSNKYMACPRGLFELKYFFTASIASTMNGAAHSAEAVRFRIKQMIDAEAPSDVLSDDAIVVKLKAANIDIARRTVAKYRESLRIPSSVERRREKSVMMLAGR